jgi:spermidine synthase
MPLLGIKGTLIFCTLIFAVPGILLMLEGRGSERTAMAGVTTVLLLALLVASVMMDIPRSILARNLTPGEEIEYLDEGPSSTIWISSTSGRFRKIWIDNLWVSSTSREGTHNLLAHYPLLFHRNPKKVAGIAFGTGQTFGACLLYPIDKIDCVEIDARVIEACKGRFDKENYGILDNPKSTIIVDDGRFYMGGTRETYDVITAEPLQPYTRGTVNLYSHEFYMACKRTLLPGGVVAQWLPLYNSGVSDTWSLIRTFAESFKHVHLFMNASDGILLGSDEEMKVDPSRPLPEAVKADLTRIEDLGYMPLWVIIFARVTSFSLPAGYPIITDDRPHAGIYRPDFALERGRDRAGEHAPPISLQLDPIEPLFSEQ